MPLRHSNKTPNKPQSFKSSNSSEESGVVTAACLYRIAFTDDLFKECKA